MYAISFHDFHGIIGGRSARSEVYLPADGARDGRGLCAVALSLSDVHGAAADSPPDRWWPGQFMEHISRQTDSLEC